MSLGGGGQMPMASNRGQQQQQMMGQPQGMMPRPPMGMPQMQPMPPSGGMFGAGLQAMMGGLPNQGNPQDQRMAQMMQDQQMMVRPQVPYQMPQQANPMQQTLGSGIAALQPNPQGQPYGGEYDRSMNRLPSSNVASMPPTMKRPSMLTAMKFMK